MRARPRSEWKVIERPEMRIVSDDVWDRVQATRKAVREAVAPKAPLARGKSGKHHSKYLFSGFATCAECGGAITTVSGGKGSPRFGCSRSWRNGTSSCGNRLTIRIKVAEPQILSKLQGELLKPEAVAYVTQRLEKEIRKALATGPKNSSDLRKRLDQEKRKVQNLVTALAEGGSNSASVLAAISDREKTIAQVERQLEAVPAKAVRGAGRRPRTLGDRAALGPRRTPEGRRPQGESRVPPAEPGVDLHAHRRDPASPLCCQGQCDLSALAFSFVRPADSRRGISSRLGALVALLREGAVHSRTPVSLGFGLSYHHVIWAGVEEVRGGRFVTADRIPQRDADAARRGGRSFTYNDVRWRSFAQQLATHA